jgi:hypothetical protein
MYTWFYPFVFTEGVMCEQPLHNIVLFGSLDLSPLVTILVDLQLCHLSTYRAVVISETCIFMVNKSSLFHLKAYPYLVPILFLV